MTSTNTSTNLKLVDLEVLDAVHNAATARLTIVQRQERAQHGVAKTDLTDVGRAALTNWSVPDLEAPAAHNRRKPIVTVHELDDGTFEARCSICTATWAGASRSEARSASRGHGRAEHMTTFRFLMDRDTYETIKQAIRGTGSSVAQVVQDGLEKFARTSEF